jgi:hypothetical protein
LHALGPRLELKLSGVSVVQRAYQLSRRLIEFHRLF